MRVQLVAEWVDADAPRGWDDLGSEGLVDLHDVDVVDRHLRSLQRLLGSIDRTKAHEFRLERGQARRDDTRDRLETELLGSTVGHHDHRRGSIVERA